jgi:ABC-2 type transport system ATP-binding protein
MADRALEIDRISKRFGEVTALRELSLDVRAGEVLGFVGRNGAGKTTTMRIVLGVLAADAGRVRWAGRALGFATRHRIGYMPEERGLCPKMGVLEQLAYFGQLNGMAVRDSLAAARSWLDRFELRDRGGAEAQVLSLGNQQRVQLAAALVRLAASEAPAWQVVAAIPFTVLTAAATTVLAGRMYANSVLRVGARVSVRDALRSGPR